MIRILETQQWPYLGKKQSAMITYYKVVQLT